MKKNHSPWIYQLNQNRKLDVLNQDICSDVCIIGAGIAGISTAFFILKYTEKKVVLVDKYKIAHGATGHNAGQIVSYFERGFASLVNDFGLSLATDAQANIENSWELFDEMYTDAGLDIPFSRFLGHAGLSSYEQIILHLENNKYRKIAGLNTEKLRISDKVNFLKNIPHEYNGLYSVVSQAEIREILEVKVDDFIAVLSYQKGCINSALFCQEVVFYLQNKYKDRFNLYENTPITKIVLKENYALLDAENNTIKSEKVILCTNGFTGFTIINEASLDINTKFYHMIHGTVGYMAGYLEKLNKNPIAISYLSDPNPNPDDPYFYLTRRSYEYEGDKDYNLISIGGPELILDDHMKYSHEHEYLEEITKKINNFVEHIYDVKPNKKIDYVFTWYGLMGYTKNGIRIIGPEPKNPVLLYNVGCNGIGILPSVFGGKRISDFIEGKEIPPAIFDVPLE